MSKDPFQILADELTLIRKDMDQLQRTSLDKDEAKKLNQIVTAAVLKMAKAAEDAPGEIQGALEADRDQMARSATQAATRAAESAMAGIRHDLDNERAKLSQAAGEARREAWRWFGGFWVWLVSVGVTGVVIGVDTRTRRCPRVWAVSAHLLQSGGWRRFEQHGWSRGLHVLVRLISTAMPWRR